MPQKKGGLGLRRVSAMNDFLLAKFLWRWHKDLGEWKNIWTNKHNRDNFDFFHFLNSDVRQGGSLIWKNVQKLENIIRKGIKWNVDNGRSILFCEDTLILDYPLFDDPRWNRFMEQCKT